VTPCLRLFSLALAGSHSNSRLIGRRPRGYHEYRSVRFRPSGLTLPADPHRLRRASDAAGVGCSRMLASPSDALTHGAFFVEVTLHNRCRTPLVAAMPKARCRCEPRRGRRHEGMGLPNFSM
jgi:hypothetical protein